MKMIGHDAILIVIFCNHTSIRQDMTFPEEV